MVEPQYSRVQGFLNRSLVSCGLNTYTGIHPSLVVSFGALGRCLDLTGLQLSPQSNGADKDGPILSELSAQSGENPCYSHISCHHLSLRPLFLQMDWGRVSEQ